MKQVVCHDEAEHRIAYKFKSLIMKTTRFTFAAGRDLLVCPRAVRHGPLQKGGLVETIAEDVLQGVEVWRAGFRFLHR